MNDEAKTSMICITWGMGLVIVFLMSMYCIFHDCSSACQNPACCKPVAEAPQK